MSERQRRNSLKVCASAAGAGEERLNPRHDPALFGEGWEAETEPLHTPLIDNCDGCCGRVRDELLLEIGANDTPVEPPWLNHGWARNKGIYLLIGRAFCSCKASFSDGANACE
jgi:hypothetical protein